MPTRRLSFATPYDPQTQIGQALARVSNALFGGPGAAEQAAAQARARVADADYEIKRREIEGRNEAGAAFDTATNFSKYSPGRARDPNDPNWDRNSQAAAAFYARHPGELAATAMRGNIPIKEVADGRVLTYSSPHFSDTMRTDAAVGAGQKVGPFSAFSEKGQLSAENRETSSKTRVAVAGAVANHPLEYDALARRKKILKDQTDDSPDNRTAARLDPMPDSKAMEARRSARDTGLTPTEIAQYETIRENLNMFMRQSPTPQIAMRQFERAFPGHLELYNKMTQRVVTFQSRPPVNGVQVINGRTFVPSSLSPGRMVEAKRGDDGKWRKMETDGAEYRLDSRDY